MVASKKKKMKCKHIHENKTKCWAQKCIQNLQLLIMVINVDQTGGSNHMYSLTQLWLIDDNCLFMESRVAIYK